MAISGYRRQSHALIGLRHDRRKVIASRSLQIRRKSGSRRMALARLEDRARGRKAPMVQREVAVVIAGRGSPSETHTLGLDWDWRLMKR